jgi:hypothetical protein
MEFFIRQTSTEPKLKLKLIDDGKNDRSSFNDLLETASITFEMFDVKTGYAQILNSSCYITTRIKKYNFTTDEYYIIYQFTESDTLIKGRFEGIITIQFVDTNSTPTTKLIVPIREKLYINII